MSLNVEVRSPAAALRAPAQHVWLTLAACALLVALVPLFVARPANLTSDESLYLAEAYNIAHGDGFTYPSGEPITHRAPLYPLLLAPAVKLGGPGAAYAVVKLVVAANAGLVALLAWRMRGALAGGIAGLTAAGAAYLNGLGTTLYLDPFECTFALLALLALHQAIRGNTIRWFAVAGALMGGALLVKEAGVQWAPLGAVTWLAVRSLRTRDGAVGAVLFTSIFAAVVAPWWAWVWVHDSSIYLVGYGALRLDLIGGTAAIIACLLMAILLARLPAGRALRVERAAGLAAMALVVAYGGLVLYGLEAHSGWKAEQTYWRTVPDYLLTVAPQAQPYFALALAWVWLGWRALRGDESARLVFVVSALFLPFALHAANRSLQLRDALPLVYLSYVALGMASADAMQRLRRAMSDPALHALAMAGAAALAGAFIAQQAASFHSDNRAAASMGAGANSWDSAFVDETARWMEENIPAGSTVLSGRLYFSSLHVKTEGRYEIRQVPTVRVEFDADGRPNAASNLFRWGDLLLRPTRASDTWLYLRRFPGKGYWVGLSQQELLEYIVANDIDYVVLTGDDVAFSTLHLAPYLTAHPAFRLMTSERLSPTEQFFAYEVDRDQLASRVHSTAISPADAAALQAETGRSLEQLAEALRTPLRVTDYERGLSPREGQAARSGTDLGLP